MRDKGLVKLIAGLLMGTGDASALSEIRELALRILEQTEAVKRAQLTIAELFDDYFAYARTHCKTFRKLEANYKRYLEPTLADTPALALTSQAVAALHNKIGANIGKPTANRILELLRAAYNRALRTGILLGTNPCLAVSPFRLSSRDRFLSDDEVRRLLQALGHCRNTNFKSFVRVCLFTGARVANVQSMRWQDLTLSPAKGPPTWRIPETKSGRPHVVPLLTDALEAIERQRGKDPYWVFPTHRRSGTGHMANPHKSWYRLCQRAGIEDVRLHDLRRTLGSWETMTGASLPIIAKTLGHVSLSATQVYARLQMQPVADAMRRAIDAMLNR